MLNISENSITNLIEVGQYESYKILAKRTDRRLILAIFLGMVIVFLASLFLPWTQNIRAKGYLTTVRPDQRPQAIQSVIAGRLEEWFVREGDLVQAGDTIVFISEVKADYFDPNLVERTNEQVEAKASSVISYNDKVSSLEDQYRALIEARDFKVEQTRNKIQQTQLKIISDSTDLVAFEINQEIAKKQFDRTQALYDKGLKSLTEFEMKKLKFQETQAKVISQTNKLLTSRNELINLQIQLSSIKSEYADKLAKSQSDKMSALSSKLEAVAETSKLRNQLGNYSRRQTLYYITAPQTGYITKAIKKGVGEIIKEGTDIVTIMPYKYDIAVEIYVNPIDIPLLEIGHEVRMQFDGWPAIVFSGWPNTSFGTFSGKIFAIDRFISDNGKYRIMVEPNDPEKPWPDLLRVGSGTNAFILLQDVFLGYEIWRQLNGFPPNFYTERNQNGEDIKLKAPLRSVK